MKNFILSTTRHDFITLSSFSKEMNQFNSLLKTFLQGSTRFNSWLEQILKISIRISSCLKCQTIRFELTHESSMSRTQDWGRSIPSAPPRITSAKMASWSAISKSGNDLGIFEWEAVRNEYWAQIGRTWQQMWSNCPFLTRELSPALVVRVISYHSVLSRVLSRAMKRNTLQWPAIAV